MAAVGLQALDPVMSAPRPPTSSAGKGQSSHKGVEADRWTRGTPLPPLPQMPKALALHKASNRYAVSALTPPFLQELRLLMLLGCGYTFSACCIYRHTYLESQDGTRQAAIMKMT